MLVKIRNSKALKVLMMCLCMLLVVSCFCLSAFAASIETSDPAVDQAAIEVFNSVHNSVNFDTVLTVLGVALGSCVAMFICWWAVRKVSRMVIKAFTKGKISV